MNSPESSTPVIVLPSKTNPAKVTLLANVHVSSSKAFLRFVILVTPVPPLPTAKVPVTPISVTAAVPSKFDESVSLRVTCKALVVANAVAVSALPSSAPSNLVASISPEALKTTPSPALTLNVISLSVVKSTKLSASLPILRSVAKVFPDTDPPALASTYAFTDC